MEDDIAYLHVRLEKQNDLEKKNDELKDSIAICKSELDSLNILDAKRKENKNLQEELDRVCYFFFFMYNTLYTAIKLLIK